VLFAPVALSALSALIVFMAVHASAGIGSAPSSPWFPALFALIVFMTVHASAGIGFFIGWPEVRGCADRRHLQGASREARRGDGGRPPGHGGGHRIGGKLPGYLSLSAGLKFADVPNVLARARGCEHVRGHHQNEAHDPVC
jgi:hypothetical protein